MNKILFVFFSSLNLHHEVPSRRLWWPREMTVLNYLFAIGSLPFRGLVWLREVVQPDYILQEVNVPGLLLIGPK